jgi:tetratricopeptide (TPR) repeat protein
MTSKSVVLACLVVAATAASPAAAQPKWVEAKGPTVTVVTDSSAGRARDIAWQFEQVREAAALTFPWVRTQLSRPLVVIAARDLTTMRALAPALFERPDGHTYVSVSAGGQDRAYVALRADFRGDDREGSNPYQSAYWAFASQALADTSSNLPMWLRRGLAELISNTLVRDKEIQVGRLLTNNLVSLRSQGRLALKELVGMANDDPRLRRPEFLGDVDANAWAFVHFLVFAENGGYQKRFISYITALLNGAESVNVVASTIGDLSQLETPFHIYVNRDVFPFTRLLASAKLGREGFAVRDVPLGEALALRAAMHVAMNRPVEARALIAESKKLDVAAGADEADALLADLEDRDDDVRASLEEAVTQKSVSWYGPYRLATLTPLNDGTMPKVEAWLRQATALNPNADEAWAFLGEVMSALERGGAALAPIEKAVALTPASSRHRVTLARVLRRLNRRDEAMKAAGIARALAKTQPERAAAQGLLAELAKAELATKASLPSPGGIAGDARPSSEASTTPNPTSAPPALADPPVDAASLAGATSVAPEAEVGLLLASCMSDIATCRKALPVIAGACNSGGAPSSGAACRNAGYIVDAGIGVPATPGLAADFYRKGCARKDEISCVRLATLQSLGRGVPRDAAAALSVLDASCSNDVQEACFRLGVHLSATKVPADLARARDVLSTSCAAGFDESCAWLKKLPPG